MSLDNAPGKLNKLTQLILRDVTGINLREAES